MKRVSNVSYGFGLTACRCSSRYNRFIGRGCRCKVGHRCFIKPKGEESGFTLIELLIYIAIFATMIGAVVGLALLASSQKIISQNTADLNYQGEATMAMITQTVRRSTAITSPAAGNTSGTLSLTMATANVNPTVFGSTTHATTTRMRISEGNPAVHNNLTNGRVTLSNLTFTNMSNPSTKGSVQIRFTLSYRTASTRPELQLSKTFYGAATIP